MLLRRPHLLMFEPRERPEDALRSLFEGAQGGAAVAWVALAPHLTHECMVEAGDLAVFQALGPGESADRQTLARDFGAARIERLRTLGLLLDDGPDHAEWRRRDARLREAGWWGPAAVAQVFGRWDGVDVAKMEAVEGRRTVHALIRDHGLPPPECLSLRTPGERIALPPPAASPLDDLLGRRVTCRNFDVAAWLPADAFAQVLHRAFAAQGRIEVAPGASMLKKHSPSGGGLHPIEAFVLAQRVDGVAPGLYHYHCLAHALEPMARLSPDEATAAAAELVAGQPWFAGAPALVLMAARFPRNSWKYRGHPKAWKAVQLDAGHLSQTLYLAATERGLGAFVTAAINDACAERLFGLDGLDIGPVVVSGFGLRAERKTVRELDPARPVRA